MKIENTEMSYSKNSNLYLRLYWISRRRIQLKHRAFRRALQNNHWPVDDAGIHIRASCDWTRCNVRTKLQNIPSGTFSSLFYTIGILFCHPRVSKMADCQKEIR